MKKGTAIGTSDFKTLRDQNSYYVDKSLMIKEVIEDDASVILLPRPRRFGKTLNMSMLRYFFDCKNSDENRKLFDGLKIASEDVFNLYQGKHPVIFISFKDIKESNFDDALKLFAKEFGQLFEPFKSVFDESKFSETEISDFHSIRTRKAEKSILRYSLELLIKILYKIYNVRPIVLIDEYDTPIHSAFTNQYYTAMIDFMRSLLGSALKDNIHLQKGILTGTLRISKESIFTGFNNPSVYTILSSEFSQFFGFTPEELKEMLVYYEIEHLEPEIKNWYNGYIFGSQEIYNPWSILKFVASKDKRFIAHWVNTSSNDLIKELIEDSPAVVRTELHDLMNGAALIKTMIENISFPELKYSSESIFSFLVFSGYLKAKLLKFENSDYWYELTIPNQEVVKMFETIIMNWFQDSFQQSKSTVLIQALLENDIELFEEILNLCVVQTLSCYDVEKREVERVYQAFILGLLVSLSPQYEVTSNKESGYGRYDICIIPLKNDKPAIVMELKSLRQKETAKKAIVSALQQIEDRQYETAIRQRGYNDIVKLAVVFDGKRVWVKEGKKQ